MWDIDKLNSVDSAELAVAFSELAKSLDFQIESVDSLVDEWVSMNITIEDIDQNKMVISWDRSYRAGRGFDDYHNNGRISCGITGNNLWCIVNNDEESLEGDWTYYQQLQEEKHGDSEKIYHYASIDGIRHTHKSELASNIETVRKYPTTLLPLLKGEMVVASDFMVSIWGKEKAIHCHKITNYDELPTWIADSKEQGYFVVQDFNRGY